MRRNWTREDAWRRLKQAVHAYAREPAEARADQVAAACARLRAVETEATLDAAFHKSHRTPEAESSHKG